MCLVAFKNCLHHFQNTNANKQDIQVLQNIIGDLTKNIKELKKPEVVTVNVGQDKQEDYDDSEDDYRFEDSGPSTYWLDFLLRVSMYL